MDQVKVGKYIKRKRVEKGMTQQALADILNISVKSVSRWENGSNMPDVSMIIPLADAISVSASELLEGQDQVLGPGPSKNLTEQIQECDTEVNRMKGIGVFAKIVLVISFLFFIDTFYGYFSVFLKWNVNDRTFAPKGILYRIIYGNIPVANDAGTIISEMFKIFLIAAGIFLLAVLMNCLLYYAKNRKK